MYTYGLPRHSEEKLRWIKAIPRINPSIIDKKKKTFVCEKHWPTGFKPSEIPTPPPLQERQKNRHSLFEVERRINGMHLSMQIKSPSRSLSLKLAKVTTKVSQSYTNS